MFNKKLLLALSVFGILLVCSGCNLSTPEKGVNFVVSADGMLEPGQRQDYLIYQLDQEFRLASQTFNLDVRLETNDSHAKFITIAENQNQNSARQPRHCTFMIPEEANISDLFLNLYSTDFKARLLYSQPLSNLKNLRLAVSPQQQPHYCGEWLNLKIAAFNPRNLTGQYKIPIRVRMTTPFGLTTINRILTSEVDGFANFSTFINSNSPQGIYKFEISAQNNLLTLSLPVLSADKRIHSISTRLPVFGINTLANPGKELAQNDLALSFPPDQEIIQTLKPANQQIKFDFNCGESGMRSAEVWQNGILLNYSELPIAAGNSSHPLPRSLQPEMPMCLKVWFHDGQSLHSQQKTFFMSDSGKNPIKDFLAGMQAYSTTEDPIVNDFLVADSLLGANFATTSAQLRQIRLEPENFHAGPADKEPAKFDLRRLPTSRKKLTAPANRFYLVENEFDLSRFNFDRLKIHLNPRQFYRRFITSLYQPVSDIETIVSEAEARLLRFEFLSPPEQESELEKIEGLLIPLAEFVCATPPSDFPDLYQRTRNLLNNLESLLYLPPELKSPDKSNGIYSLGPISPFLETSLTRDMINRVVKTGGKVRIKTETHEFPVNLNAKVVDFKNRAGQRRILDKLINLRTEPVLIELIFRDQNISR